MVPVLPSWQDLGEVEPDAVVVEQLTCGIEMLRRERVVASIARSNCRVDTQRLRLSIQHGGVDGATKLV